MEHVNVPAVWPKTESGRTVTGAAVGVVVPVPVAGFVGDADGVATGALGSTSEPRPVVPERLTG